MDLKKYLEQMVQMREQFTRPKELRYLCMEDFVLKEGFYARPTAPLTHPKGPVKECFRNAALLALEHPNKLTYVEGFAKNIIPTLHAWCVDQNGNVVDPTWAHFENAAITEYYGVPFTLGFLRHTLLTRRVYGVIDNPEEKFPLLRGVSKEWKAPIPSRGPEL